MRSVQYCKFVRHVNVFTKTNRCHYNKCICYIFVYSIVPKKDVVNYCASNANVVKTNTIIIIMMLYKMAD